MIKRGYLFQRYMPTHWSPSSKTALAESELEYDENHTSTAAYVAFPLDASSARKGNVYLRLVCTHCLLLERVNT